MGIPFVANHRPAIKKHQRSLDHHPSGQLE
jgi:hypothetical protein